MELISQIPIALWIAGALALYMAWAIGANDVHLTGMAMVTGSISEAGTYSSGTGLMPNREWRRSAVRFRQLDDLVKRLVALEQKTPDKRD